MPFPNSSPALASTEKAQQPTRVQLQISLSLRSSDSESSKKCFPDRAAEGEILGSSIFRLIYSELYTFPIILVKIVGLGLVTHSAVGTSPHATVFFQRERTWARPRR